MNIKFKKVKINNFLSIGNAEVELSDNGFTLINGINKCTDDNASSNGSGKSSIIDSIIWALTGETSRGTKDVVNKYTTTGTIVELLFSIDKDEYKIIRCKESKEFGTNLFIYINDENKSGKGIRDTQELLEQYLPDLTPQLLGSVILLGQGLPQRFTNNTPSGRKEILEKLTKSDFMIADIKDRLSKRKAILTTEIRTLEDNILSDSSKKSVLENQLQKLREDKTLLVPLDSFDNDILNTETNLSKFNDLKYKLDIEKDNTQLKLDTKLDEYQKWVASVNSNINSESIYIEENNGLNTIKKCLDNITRDIQLKENEIKKLESIKDTCPTCGQHLPDVHKVDTTNLHNELNLLLEKQCQIKTDMDNKQKIVDNKIELLKEDLNKTTENIKKEGSELREKLNIINSDLNKYNSEINSLKLTLDKLKLNKENNEKQYKTIDGDIKECEIQITQLSDKILYNNMNKDNKNQHLEIINKMTSIATRDFRGYLLLNIIEYIELKAKEYSHDIFETDKVDFKLDGNNIFIGYNEKAYENLSGGEKQKIDLIIQFSIRDMLSQYLDFSSNILALDEIFDGLDYLSCQKVVNLISNKFTDVESVYVITHHKDLDIPYDKEIVVMKNENGISEIV